MKLCIKCKKKEIFVKKRSLCVLCYQSLRRKKGPFLQNVDPTTPHVLEKKVYAREVDFIRNYFNHKNWYYEVATFRLPSGKYTPDFYDGVRNVFIEVSGTRQAFHINKIKYDEFKQAFPLIKLEIRNTNGDLLNTDSRMNWNPAIVKAVG